MICVQCAMLLSSSCLRRRVLLPAAARRRRRATARVQVTVVDPSSAVVPDATVDARRPRAGDAGGSGAVGQDAPTRASRPSRACAPGRYSIRAEFPGFDLGLLRDVRVRAGDNRHVVVLPLQRLEDTVTVSQDTQAAAADRRRSEFGVQLPTIRSRRCPTIRWSWRGSSPSWPGPTRSSASTASRASSCRRRRRSSRSTSTRDQFAAEAAQPGSTFVDVVTQPGIGPIRGELNFSLRDGSMTGRSQFTPTRGAGAVQQLRRQHRRHAGQGQDQLLAS